MDNLKQTLMCRFKLVKNNFINKNGLTKINQSIKPTLKNQSMVTKLKSFITTYLPVFSKLNSLTYSTISTLTIGVIAVLVVLDITNILSTVQLV